MYEWISTIHGMCDGAFHVVLVHLTRPAVNVIHTAPNSTVINRQSIWTDVERGNFRSIFNVATPFTITD